MIFIYIILIFLASCSTQQPNAVVSSNKITVPAEDKLNETAELDALHAEFTSGKLIEAEARAAMLMEKRPNNRYYPVLRSSILISMGKNDSARQILTKEISDHPDNTEAILTLAELERFSGNSTAYKANVEDALAKDPNNVAALTTMGDILFDSKSYQKAEEFYQKALSKDANNSDALRGLARVYHRRGNSKEAITLLDTAIKNDPNNSIAYSDRSRALYNVGRYAECEADLDKAISLAPMSSWNYVERGKLYMDTGRKQEAIADFTKSIQLNPEFFLPYIYRASIYEEQSKDIDAYNDYEKATAMYPDYWFAFESMGVLSYRLGRWDKASAAFTNAANYTKSHAEYYIASALALMRSGNIKASKEYAGKYLSKIDKNKYYIQWLALRLFYDQTEMTNELEIKINSEKLLDTKASMLFYLGAYWLAKGKTDLGLKYIKMSYDSERIGTIERRMAEGDLTRYGLLKK